MNIESALTNGLAVCEEAFDRLVAGKSVVPNHVGLNLAKITASIVSLEAGFDRGYLKKSRKSHQPLLAKIEAVRTSASKGTMSNDRQLRNIGGQLTRLGRELSSAQIHRDRVLAQNIKLWARVRELELLLETQIAGKVAQFRRPL